MGGMGNEREMAGNLGRAAVERKNGKKETSEEMEGEEEVGVLKGRHRWHSLLARLQDGTTHLLSVQSLWMYKHTVISQPHPIYTNLTVYTVL